MPAQRALRNGRRLLLRRPLASDAAEVTALARASQGLLRPWVPVPVTPVAYRRWLKLRQPPRNEPLLLCRKSDGAVIASFNINEIVYGVFCSAFLGYWVGAPYARQGYGLESLRLVIRYAFRDLKLHRLEANIQPENIASRALVRKAGFELEGVSPRYLKIGGRWRDHERWAVRSDQ